MIHGPNFTVLGFRLGNFAYCTDASHIPDASIELLRGIETFVVGALRFKPHPTHFNIDQAVEAARRIEPRRTFLTHVGHELDHERTNASLPAGIELAYDGLRVSIVTGAGTPNP
jgi:phosphoribosyl 1,2-cyclic phosphate phosphodiesterase